MKNRYLLLIDYEKDFKDFLLELLTNSNSLTNSSYTVIKFKSDLSKDEIIENIKAYEFDTNSNALVYISGEFDNQELEEEHIEMVYNYLKDLNKDIYDDKSLLKEQIVLDTFDMKAYILKDFLYDYEMLNIVKTFIKNNMNTLKSSKELYMHRNTLINKIDRFNEVTGFDIRNFEDAMVIYLLIK